jgi:transcriptional regulator with XRE-family HTH domain
MAKIRAILAENIKEYRRKIGITQSELAERSNISANFMGMIEQERKFPTPEITVYVNNGKGESGFAYINAYGDRYLHDPGEKSSALCLKY